MVEPFAGSSSTLRFREDPPSSTSAMGAIDGWVEGFYFKFSKLAEKKYSLILINFT
jgi:hypothetical protein